MSEEKTKRPSGIPVFEADELGYKCPNNHNHKICWSEYEAHIWCYDCEKDIPSKKCHLVQPEWMNDEKWVDFLNSLPFEPKECDSSDE